jgi:protein phosphatase
LRVEAFGITDAGRVRACNEDQFLIAELAKTMRLWQTSLPEPEAQTGNGRAHLFVVADGMGGQAAGDRASALAVAAIENFALNTVDTHDSEAKNVLAQFQAALRHADAHLVNEATEHPELSGMGTTVTLAYHLGTHLCIVHVGDSRAYLYRNNTLHQLTEDHTVTAELIRTGNLRPEQAAEHPLRHVITNVVGGERTGVDVETHLLDIRAGDQLLLCSDGLTEMVQNDAIAATLSAAPDPEGACRQLLAQANEKGGRDNITLLIARFDSPA